MGSLKIGYIKQTEVAGNGHLYSDLYLDLTNDYKTTGNFRSESTKLVDIKIAYDQYAIKNSLTSLFNTNIGQRILLPKYGINIKRYLFSPVSVTNAYAMGAELKEGIERWEPRVTVKLITVQPVPDDNRYDLRLDLFVPSLGIPVSYAGTVVKEVGISLQ